MKRTNIEILKARGNIKQFNLQLISKIFDLTDEETIKLLEKEPPLASRLAFTWLLNAKLTNSIGETVNNLPTVINEPLTLPTSIAKIFYKRMRKPGQPGKYHWIRNDRQWPLNN